MLVVVSDLHLSDGSRAPSLDAGVFTLFAEQLRQLALRASWRTDGYYRPVERIDLVLLGDVLDVVRSQQWLAGSLRPWDDLSQHAAVEKVSAIVRGILEHNAPALNVLRALATEGAVFVPPANQAGQAAWGPQGHFPAAQPVPVYTHYMVGNADWPLHLPGAAYNALRQQVAHHLGLADRMGNPFAHDSAENDDLHETLRRHRVLARHGDVFDPLNFAEDRNAAGLGDAVAVELIGRFLHIAERELAGELPPATLAGLAHLDELRPVLLAPVYIEGLLERTCPSPAVRKQIKRIWDLLADELLELPLVKQHDVWSPFDLASGLQQALKFSRGSSLGWASRTNAWLHSLRGTATDSYVPHALAEADFRNRRARHVVYGHTHAVESVPLDASYADGNVLNQVYFNTGTWQRVYRATQLAPGEQEFIAQQAFSLLAFYQGDERCGRPFETWTGTLGIGQHDGALRRVDAAAQQRMAAPIRAPHFHAAGTHVGAHS